MQQQQRFECRELLSGSTSKNVCSIEDFIGVTPDRHVERLVLQFAADLTDGRGDRGREQQRLPLGRHCSDDAAQVVGKPHVEHAIRFVEHQHLDAFERQGFLLDQFQDAPGRADHDVRLMSKGGQVRTQWHAATEGQDLDVGNEAGETPDLAADLVGQFACRTQHEPLQRDGGCVERRQQSERKGSRLAAAGPGLRHHVTSRQDRRQAGGLHGGHVDVSDFLEAASAGVRSGPGWKIGSSAHDRIYVRRP